MDQRNLIIGGLLLAAIVTISLLVLVMMKPRSRAHQLPTPSPQIPLASETTGTNGRTVSPSPIARHFIPTPSSGSPIPPAMVSKYSAAEMATMLAEIREHEEKVRAESQKWAEQYLANPNLATHAAETFRFRMIGEYAAGTKALDAKDFPTAIREFQKALDNPNASPVSKFVIYDYMRYAAAQSKDVDLYIKILNEQANMVAQENLSVMGITKSNASKVVAEDIARHLRAMRDPQAFNALVDETSKKFLFTSADSRAKAEAIVRKRCQELERIFQ